MEGYCRLGIEYAYDHTSLLKSHDECAEYLIKNDKNMKDKIYLF